MEIIDLGRIRRYRFRCDDGGETARTGLHEIHVPFRSIVTHCGHGAVMESFGGMGDRGLEAGMILEKGIHFLRYADALLSGWELELVRADLFGGANPKGADPGDWIAPEPLQVHPGARLPVVRETSLDISQDPQEMDPFWVPPAARALIEWESGVGVDRMDVCRICSTGLHSVVVHRIGAPAASGIELWDVEPVAGGEYRIEVTNTVQAQAFHVDIGWLLV